MLNLTWIKNHDHVSYCKENEVLPRLARELGIADLAQQVEEFRTHPTAEGGKSEREETYHFEAVHPQPDLPGAGGDGGERVDLYGGAMPRLLSVYPLGGDKRELTQREGDTVMGEQKKYWEGKHFAFYTNKECEYYPCHPVPEGTEFNCLFCYCPLYMLGRKCGGNFTYLESGVKDCSECLVPHRRENYGFIADSFQKIAGEMAEREKKEGQ